MSGTTRLQQAIDDNRGWYEAMFRAHGLACHCDGRVWRSMQPAPPFHANLLLLTADTQPGDIAGLASALDAVPGIGDWSVKDAHARLDLTPLGLVPLFEAQWIWRPADPAWPDRAAAGHAGLRWARCTAASDLEDWMRAWQGDARNEDGVAPADPFPPPIQASADHAFLAGWLEGQLRVGAIARRGAAMVGLSNLFAPEALAAPAWQGLVSQAVATFPGLPLVGYERGDDLAHAQAVGFQPVGPLRVWQRRRLRDTPVATGPDTPVSSER